ncbi:granzyme K-like [Hemibagrus wyckioides]|uniref:granzyme K-like n=1 Tax=Hemibagrus wyckioides TaxID=337641 RepID=UPI00266CFD95|nr:granzyme K-like [Hemibagrus wyckioides]
MMKTLHILLLAAAFTILTFHGTHGEDIINGQKAKENSFQFMASVQYKHVHTCGGFLINPSYVLTAAHCYFSTNSQYLSVVLGSHNIDSEMNNLRRYLVQIVYIHPSYDGYPVAGSDIMLLKLLEEVKLNDKHVKSIKISKNPQLDTNTKCQVAGWGETKKQQRFESPIYDLMEADVSIINITVCKEEWAKVRTRLPDNILCAGGYKSKSGACQGDSGGPLVCNGVAVGIVSFNYDNYCEYPDVPNVYTEISPYVDWIKKVIEADR